MIQKSAAATSSVGSCHDDKSRNGTIEVRDSVCALPTHLVEPAAVGLCIVSVRETINNRFRTRVRSHISSAS